MKLFNFTLPDLSKPKESKLFLSLIPTLKEKKTQQFTTLSLTLATIAFFGFFAISPTLGTITDLQKQLDDNTFVNKQLQTKIANLTTLQTQYQQIGPFLPPVFAAVPASPSIDTFVGQIHQLAAQGSVQLNRVQTLPLDLSPTSAKYLAYSFSIEAQGLFPALQVYLVQLGSFNRLITFDSVDYTRVGRIDTTFRATIRGKAYFKTE